MLNSIEGWYARRARSSATYVVSMSIAALLIGSCAETAENVGTRSSSTAALSTTSHASPIQIPSLRSVMLLGDSLTGGVGATVEQGSFANLILGSLRSQGAAAKPRTPPSVPRPKGTPTTAMSFDPSRIPSELDLAVIELGTNDASASEGTTGFSAGYRAILSTTRQRNARSVVICLGVWGVAPQIDEIIERECLKVGGIYIPLEPLYSDLDDRGPSGRATYKGRGDDFHPNDLGHKKIADEILTKLGAS